MLSNIEKVQNNVSYHMDQILKNFISDAKISVIVRIPENDNADFLMTNDNIDEIISLLQRRKQKKEN